MQTTRTLPTRRASLTEEFAYRLLTLSVTECVAARPGYHYDVDIGFEVGPMRSIDFPEIAFDTIPHHGAADLARYDTAKFASLTVPPGHVTHKLRTHPFRSHPVHP